MSSSPMSSIAESSAANLSQRGLARANVANRPTRLAVKQAHALALNAARHQTTSATEGRRNHECAPDRRGPLCDLFAHLLSIERKAEKHA